MTRRSRLELAAAAGYVATTLLLTYGVWNVYARDVDRPVWADEPVLFPVLLAVHVAAGAATGRWWALALPVLWGAASIPAQGYDTPIGVIVLVQLPFVWLPAIAAGVAAAAVPSPVAR